jgi:hypothetical protein
MWMHTQGPVPGVLEWLGATLLVGAVLGVHVNATLAWMGLRAAVRRPSRGCAPAPDNKETRHMGKITGFLEYERLEEGYEPAPERAEDWKEFVIT